MTFFFKLLVTMCKVINKNFINKKYISKQDSYLHKLQDSASTFLNLKRILRPQVAMR
jgi:hypothetical protein